MTEDDMQDVQRLLSCGCSGVLILVGLAVALVLVAVAVSLL